MKLDQAESIITRDIKRKADKIRCKTEPVQPKVSKKVSKKRPPIGAKSSTKMSLSQKVSPSHSLKTNRHSSSYMDDTLSSASRSVRQSHSRPEIPFEERKSIQRRNSGENIQKRHPAGRIRSHSYNEEQLRSNGLPITTKRPQSTEVTKYERPKEKDNNREEKMPSKNDVNAWT